MSDPGDPNQPTAGRPPEYPPPPPPPPPPYGSQPGYGGYPPYPGAVPVNPYAHWGLRVGGYLLDSLVVLPFFVVAEIAMVATADPNGDPSPGGLLVAVVAYLAGAVFSIWNQFVRQGRTGQSLGKQWVGIRLLSEQTGRPLGGWLTFGRSLLHILDALACYVGFLWPLWDAKRQTFADKIVRSVVLRQEATVPPASPPAPTW